MVAASSSRFIWNRASCKESQGLWAEQWRVKEASQVTCRAHLFSGAVALDNITLKHVAPLPLAREHNPPWVGQHPTPLCPATTCRLLSEDWVLANHMTSRLLSYHLTGSSHWPQLQSDRQQSSAVCDTYTGRHFQLFCLWGEKIWLSHVQLHLWDTVYEKHMIHCFKNL